MRRTTWTTWFLLQLCGRELLDRERRAAEWRLKSAKFPTLKTLDDFDFAAQPSLNKVLVAELMRGEFVDRRESVILVGNSGTGKTHLAAQTCRRGKRVRFYRVYARTDVGRATFILGTLIARKKAVPMLVVMPFGHAVPFGGPGDNAQMFEQHLLEDVMPAVEVVFRTAAGRESRAVVGLSMGWSTWTGSATSGRSAPRSRATSPPG